MSEVISRQDAKDAIDMALDHIDHVPPWVYDKLLNVLNEVPSAEKAQLSGEDATKDATSDLISRQDAIRIAEQGQIQGFEWQFKKLCTLPSAEPEPIRINLNEPIKVKLTDWGKEIYYHQYDSINQIYGRVICKPSLPKEDENGYAKFQLWCFMELYGMHIGMTLPNVIEPIEIVYEG